MANTNNQHSDLAGGKIMRTLLVIALLLLLYPICTFAGSTGMLEELNREKATLEPQMLSVAHFALDHYLRSGKVVTIGNITMKMVPKDSLLRSRRAGLFATLVVKNHSRGCIGNIQPTQASLLEEIISDVLKAYIVDRRYHRVTIAELPKVGFSLTVIGGMRRIATTEQYDPVNEGVFMRKGSQSALLLPKEAKSRSAALRWVRSKAGIPVQAMVEMFVFPAVQFGVRIHPKG